MELNNANAQIIINIINNVETETIHDDEIFKWKRRGKRNYHAKIDTNVDEIYYEVNYNPDGKYASINMYWDQRYGCCVGTIGRRRVMNATNTKILNACQELMEELKFIVNVA